jgi:cytochrome c553
MAASFIAFCLCGTTTLQASANPARGGELTTTCMGCHGIEGYRNGYPSYRVPRLGGQKPDYIVSALQDYKNQNRAHPTMHAQAASMSDQDMQDIAAFFASQGEPKTGQTRADGRLAAGKAKSAVCAACHGEAGISPTPVWPNLAGQHEDYLAQAITEYQNGERKHPVMTAQAASLKKDDIRELAAYFAAQPGLFRVHYAEARQK